MELRLCESDFRFMCVVWENEPISSRNLVIKCNEQLGWKKSTTYTVLKKLSEKGFAKNESSVITSLVPKSEVQEYAGNQFIESTFDGSLPSFLASFFGGKKISDKEAEQLKALIDNYTEDK